MNNDNIMELFLVKTSLVHEVNKLKVSDTDFLPSDFLNLLVMEEITNASEKLDVLEDHYADVGNRFYNPGNGKLYSFRKPVNFNNGSVCGLDHCLFPMFSKRPIVVKQNELRIFKLGIDKMFDDRSKLEKNRRYRDYEIKNCKALLNELKRMEFYYGLEAGMYLYHIDLRYETYDGEAYTRRGYEMILI